MPKNKNIQTVLIIGSGPIVIGQACEFDYSGTQAAVSLREEGVKVILINNNPATIMTDPMIADRVYLLPLTVSSIEQILSENNIDGVLPTMGGQTALNLCKEVNELGIWKKNNITVLGTDMEGIEKAEDREKFRNWMLELGIPIANGKTVHSLLQGNEWAHQIGFPLILRPSFTLGGSGGSIVYRKEDLSEALQKALATSPIHQVLIEKAVIGWSEFELEVLKDTADQVVVISGIENIDPMGIHTGDSITVCPPMTINDQVFQKMRNTAIKILQNFQNFSGGCNVQFALHPDTGEMLVVEINPRVSRSSALASKATGYPIAKVAAKLALGYHLDELINPVTKNTTAFFEPALDYVVVKIPVWNFEKFKGAQDVLGPQMKSVGEVMGIGRSFAEALQKALQSTDNNKNQSKGIDTEIIAVEKLLQEIRIPNSNRMLQIKRALELDISVNTICETTQIHPWFILQLKKITDCEKQILGYNINTLPNSLLIASKQLGISDHKIAELLSCISDQEVYMRRKKIGLKRVFKSVDTCSAEFKVSSNYFYSTFEIQPEAGNWIANESVSNERKKILVIGSGPNKIGQGIEFDYSCVHGVRAIRDAGYEAIMLNCNPETVSTDFDIADKLYFEPLHWEYLLEIIEHENPKGVVLQLGGQTSLQFAKKLEESGIKIFGTSFTNMDKAEDRVKFSELLQLLEIPYPSFGTASNIAGALKIANTIKYPVLLRPSYVLGGQRMSIVLNDEELKKDIEKLWQQFPDNKILIDRFLNGGQEAEVDAIFDGQHFHIMGMMEHIEPAGIHSGDSHSVLPPFSLSPALMKTMENYAEKIARHLNIKGLINIQFVIKDNVVYVIEANPRASRTIPFISKVYNIPYLDIATKVMIEAAKLVDFKFDKKFKNFALKLPVFSFDKFDEVDRKLGPEMKSTGEAIQFINDVQDPSFRKLFNEKSMLLSK